MLNKQIKFESNIPENLLIKTVIMSNWEFADPNTKFFRLLLYKLLLFTNYVGY